MYCMMYCFTFETLKSTYIHRLLKKRIPFVVLEREDYLEKFTLPRREHLIKQVSLHPGRGLDWLDLSYPPLYPERREKRADGNISTQLRRYIVNDKKLG